MNISYNWLKDLVEIDLPPQELAERLTGVGLAVEGVHQTDGDSVFDVDLTSNRADCLSHLGVAREIGAITNRGLRVADSTTDEGRETTDEIEDLTSVIVEDAELCPRYTARVIRGVRIAPSPEWLVKRLEAIGQRSINNVADVTNYVMHELGQPLHAFDFDKLSGQKIVVRRARAGEDLGALDGNEQPQQIRVEDDLFHSRTSERLVTLDAVERELTDSMLVIADAEKPVAIGGVMGGENSAISDETANVLIEAAYFKPESVRRTQRKLQMNTEAGYRFERGTDIENVLNASDRCVQLICEIAGGVATANAIDVYAEKPKEILIPFRPARVSALTGLEVEPEKMLHVLEKLGFEMRENALNEPITFVAPTWRIDMEREEDLVEEIARHVGFDKIVEELPPAFGAGEYQPNEKRKKAVRQTFADLGFNEAISYSFIDARHDEQFELLPGLLDEFAEEKFVTLRDSIIEGAVRMRPTLLAGLLDAVRRNLNFGERNLKLFEIGKIFAGFGGIGSLPTEREGLALILTGGERLANTAETARELDFYDAKGALEAAVAAMNLPELGFAAAEIKHLRKGQAAEVRFGNEKVGTIGRLSDEIVQNYKFKQAVFVAEVDLQKLFETDAQPVLYKPLPKNPAVVRDVSLLVKRTNSFGEIRAFVDSLNAEFYQNCEFIDIYEGSGMKDDERSLTIRLVYRASDKTLRDEEVETAHKRILAALENQFDLRLRF